MIEPSDEGGPAFPVIIDKNQEQFAPGMTLRDWFAGQALTGLLAADLKGDGAFGPVKDAYEIADAMLRERSK